MPCNLFCNLFSRIFVGFGHIFVEPWLFRLTNLLRLIGCSEMACCGDRTAPIRDILCKNLSPGEWYLYDGRSGILFRNEQEAIDELVRTSYNGGVAPLAGQPWRIVMDLDRWREIMRDLFGDNPDASPRPLAGVSLEKANQEVCYRNVCIFCSFYVAINVLCSFIPNLVTGTPLSTFNKIVGWYCVVSVVFGFPLQYVRSTKRIWSFRLRALADAAQQQQQQQQQQQNPV